MAKQENILKVLERIKSLPEQPNLAQLLVLLLLADQIEAGLVNDQLPLSKDD